MLKFGVAKLLQKLKIEFPVRILIPAIASRLLLALVLDRLEAAQLLRRATHAMSIHTTMIG
jgi:hypothetical protein